ncbi:uncharacterized protein [Eurosta solidaginis]|uniref:uncharacterized protein n=1 Tax=Eurosta solidaginis TaxID=178769 RepID=UPI0035311A75
MAPCQVHPIILHTNSSSIRATPLNARTPPTPPVRPTTLGGVRRNLFGTPDQREMVRQLDNENARQRKRLENYKIIEPIAQTKENSKVSELLKEEKDDKSLLPDLIAKELEAHEKAQQRKRNKWTTSDIDGNDGDDAVDADALALRRQEQIETTPTAMITKTKLRTIHINRTANDAALNEVARYKPYSKQTLITDSMPKRKAIPPP